MWAITRKAMTAYDAFTHVRKQADSEERFIERQVHIVPHIHVKTNGIPSPRQARKREETGRRAGRVDGPANIWHISYGIFVMTHWL